MSWLNGLSREEKEEMFEDACIALQRDTINESEFRTTLGKLGYNATDIEETVRFYRPSPPENDGD